jgi:hypothetical protein
MTAVSISDTLLPPPDRLIGSVRRFGPFGPLYEVIGLGRALPDGDHAMRVRVVETGEELDYRWSEILADPRED